MTPRSTIAGFAAALAAGALLAACGSSGPSKKEFVKKADALCAQTNKAHPPKPNPKNSKEAAAQQAEEPPQPRIGRCDELTEDDRSRRARRLGRLRTGDPGLVDHLGDCEPVGAVVLAADHGRVGGGTQRR